ncbi:MAG: amidophosphoribosyltransferase [Candidatus Atribacteria bacterium]|nr:amidophosphoribosyltransferase [Candidatus Atribacteria bacterium]
MMDTKEKCGVFGVYGLPNAAEIAYLGLFSLQHRGQESAGIVTIDGKAVCERKGMGLVSEVFAPADLERLSGSIALGHVRYSTTGSSSVKNIQPLVGDSRFGSVGIAHNGNLANSITVSERLRRSGAVFQSFMDTELILHLIAQSGFDSFEDAVKEALWQVRGAFSLGIVSRDKLIAVRDPWGFRPLCLGKLDGGYLISSESCAFEVLGADLVREIEPGEMLIIDSQGPRSFSYAFSPRKAFCVFELIYFARPDSLVFGNSVYQVRKNMGRALAEQEDKEADLVVPVPDSGIYAALGFAQATGIPFELGMIRNPYVGRTFIRPTQEARKQAVQMKLDPVREVIKGKRIIVVEDSIVRGNTSRRRIATLKKAGAREVHMRVSSPPHCFPCFYGIDFPTKEELIANRMNSEEIKNFLKLDSLRYIDIDGLKASILPPGDNYCFSCFTGDYPILPDQGLGKEVWER